MEYTYYFPIFNLHITHSFQIGNTTFQMFDKAFMDDLFKKYNSPPYNMSAEKFDLHYRKEYQNLLIASVKSSIDRDKAESFVKFEVEKSTDILKIIALAPFPSENWIAFDLNFRLNYQMQIEFLTKKENDISLLTNKSFENHRPLILNVPEIFKNQGNAIASFSEFITQTNRNEFSKLILNAIEMYSFALSTKDLHRRVVSLITILESLLLRDEEEYKKLAEKTRVRLSKIISGTIEEKQSLKDLFERIYNIRHKMVHKAIRLPINIDDLTNAQRTIIEMLFYIIKINTDGIIDKPEFISYIENLE